MRFVLPADLLDLSGLLCRMYCEGFLHQNQPMWTALLTEKNSATCSPVRLKERSTSSINYESDSRKHGYDIRV